VKFFYEEEKKRKIEKEKNFQLATDEFVPFSVNLQIRPFWNNKNNYEIFFLCFFSFA
jgi:hypothetical protein